MLPKNWKKSFNSGVIIPTQMGFCKEYTDKITCNRCNSQLKENKYSKLF